jgi:lipoyl(octanoyl) transferase
MDLVVEWLGHLPYREAWQRQRSLVAARDAGTAPDTLLLVEHDAVLTLGRHATEAHVIASPAELERRGIEVIRVERGGEVTYHGPGQLVAYPIVRLAERGVLLRPFVRALETAMADVAAGYDVAAAPRPGYPGVWVDPASERPRKLGALGLRVERGITYHGIALNVTTRLSDFGLIDPCGMAALDVTSIARERGWRGAAAEPSTALVEDAGRRFAEAFGQRLATAASQPTAGVADAERASAGASAGAAGAERASAGVAAGAERASAGVGA